MKRILLILSLCTSFLCNSQDEGFDYVTELARSVSIPSSPQSAAFMQYGNTNVNLYTGTPEINVPIYTYKGREMNLPINLNYDATGIKVDQLANHAGLSWNLNAGGRITRVTNGFPDDFLKSVPSRYLTIMDNEVREKILKYKKSRTRFDTSQGVLDYFNFLTDLSTNYIDAQPDLFSLNAIGINDYIVFDMETMMPKTLNNPRIKVDVFFDSTNSYIVSWVVTNDDGTKFFFGRNGSKQYIELTRTEGDNDNSPGSVHGFIKEFYSSWMLTKIESPNKKDKYEFDYTNFDIYQNLTAYNEIHNIRNEIRPNAHGVQYGIPQSNISGNKTEVKQQFLSSVTYNGKPIIDISFKNRCDVDVNSAIDKIVVKNTYNQVLRNFTFSHSYFGDIDGCNTNKKSKIRLKLDEIIITDAKNKNPHSYQFVYQSPEQVPDRASLSRDYLGYYNNEDNTVLYPGVVSGDIIFPGANRKPNPTTSIFGMIKQIYYPTGGSTEYHFGNHTSTWTTDDEITRERDVRYADLRVIGGVDLTTPCNLCCQDAYGSPTPPRIDQEMFTINESDYYTLKVVAAPRGVDFQKEAYIVRTSSHIPFDKMFHDSCVPIDIDIVWLGTSSDNEKIFLEAGTYEATAVAGVSRGGDGGGGGIRSNNSSSNGGGITLSLKRNELVRFREPGTGKAIRAGVRINTIIDHTNGSEGNDRIRNFDYSTLLDGDDSSGNIMYKPILHYFSDQLEIGNNLVGNPYNCNLITKQFLNRFSSGGSSATPHIVYSRVYEYENILKEDSDGQKKSTFNGYIQHDFNIGKSGSYTTPLPPYASFYEPNYEIGKERETAVYDNKEVEKAKTTNAYEDTEYFTQGGFYVSHKPERANQLIQTYRSNGKYKFRYISAQVANFDGGCGWYPPPSCSDPNTPCFSSTTFARLQGNSTFVKGKIGNRVSKTSTQFFKGNSITSTNFYEYDPSANFLLRSTKTINSNAEEVRTELSYPQDFDNPVYQQMKNDNHLNTIVSSKNFRNNKLISSRKTNYNKQDFGYFPSTLELAKGGNPIEERIKYNQYKNDNLVEVIRVDGTPESFIWGYNNTLPIANLRNVFYDNIPTKIIDDLKDLSNKDIDKITEVSLINKLNELRELFPNALLTTYTYDPSIGVTSITDANNIVTYYEYDDRQRLTIARDLNNHIIERFQYNYEPTAEVLNTFTLDLEVPDFATIGKSTSFISKVTGGSNNYKFEWKFITPNGVVKTRTTASVDFVFGAEFLGVTKVIYTVTDLSSGKIKKRPFDLNVYKPMSVNNITIPASVNIGTPVNFSVNPRGGSGNYSVRWELKFNTFTHRTYEKSFTRSFTCDQAPQVVVDLVVVDFKTNERFTLKKNVQIIYDDFEVRLSKTSVSKTNVEHRVKINAAIIGGSGDYGIKWYTDGRLVASQAGVRRLESSLRCGGIPKTFTCVVTDKCSGLETSLSKAYKYTRSCPGGGGTGGNGDVDQNGEDEDGNNY